MTNVAHTPGPWEAKGCVVWAIDGARGEKMSLVASTLTGELNEDRANAQLIAAAPETARKLAEAEARTAELESAVGAVNRWWKFAQENPHRETQKRMELLDAALEKCEAMEKTAPIIERLQDALFAEYMRPCDEHP